MLSLFGTMGGWLGNSLIIIAMILIGKKRSVGWLFSIAGNLCWCIYAISLSMYDILFIDGLALILAVYYYNKWVRQ